MKLMHSLKKTCRYIFWVFPLLFSTLTQAGGTDPVNVAMAHHIQSYYPEQLTNPQKKNRKSLAQFGYNLSYFKIQLFPRLKISHGPGSDPFFIDTRMMVFPGVALAGTMNVCVSHPI